MLGYVFFNRDVGSLFVCSSTLLLYRIIRPLFLPTKKTQVLLPFLGCLCADGVRPFGDTVRGPYPLGLNLLPLGKFDAGWSAKHTVVLNVQLTHQQLQRAHKRRVRSIQLIREAIVPCNLKVGLSNGVC